MVYLFIGQDSVSKGIKLKKIKEEFLPKALEDFNLDVLYAKELTLLKLQQTLLALPLGSKKRVVVIKRAEGLDSHTREFLLKYVKHPHPSILLILDIDRKDYKDEFISRICRYARVIQFKQARPYDTFALGRQIEAKRTAYALSVLNQLLKDGEKPERILGGLRYIWEKNTDSAVSAKKRFKALLDCDIEIKTGRLKPDFALEKLVVNLCGAGIAEPLC